MAKKILMLTHEFPPFRGGIGTYASQLALAAHNLGHDITVVAPDHGRFCEESDQADYPFTINRYQSETHSFKELPEMMWNAWRQYRQNRFDIVHAVDWPDILAMTLLNRLRRLPFVATVHGTDLLSSTDSRHVRYLRATGMYASPSIVYANSEYTRSLFLDKCPAETHERIVVTPLGVDEGCFETVGDATHIYEQYGIDKQHKIILTVARLDERKGHRLVLKALRKLPEDLKSQVAYVIAGGAENENYLRELKELASTSGVAVHFVGSVDIANLRGLYSQASLFCMPGEPHSQKVEGFGLAYLEAAAQGLPSIASTIGAIPEVVIDGKTGVLVEPMDVDGIAEAMVTLLRDDDLRKSMGEASRSHARQYTWKRCAELTYGVD